MRVNVYILMSLDIFIYLSSHHHSQCNRHIHHLYRAWQGYGNWPVPGSHELLCRGSWAEGVPDSLFEPAFMKAYKIYRNIPFYCGYAGYFCISIIQLLNKATKKKIGRVFLVKKRSCKADSCTWKSYLETVRCFLELILFLRVICWC